MLCSNHSELIPPVKEPNKQGYCFAKDFRDTRNVTIVYFPVVFNPVSFYVHTTGGQIF